VDVGNGIAKDTSLRASLIRGYGPYQMPLQISRLYRCHHIIQSIYLYRRVRCNPRHSI